MCYLKDMNYISVFINAIVVALMAIYVYQNESRIEKMAAIHNQTGNSIKSDLDTKSLALERMESKLNETTAILNHQNGILQDIREAEQRGNITTAILNRHSDILQEIHEAVRKDNPDVENLHEVAEGKTSTQSSQHRSFKPGNANDGNLNTFSHTVYNTPEQSPYWEVDLGRNYKIRQIEIFVRRDCCGDLIRKLDITAGPSHNLMTLCGFYSGPAKTGDHLVFECRPTINGRYVRIQKNDSTNLALAEVQVMAIVDRTVG